MKQVSDFAFKKLRKIRLNSKNNRVNFNIFIFYVILFIYYQKLFYAPPEIVKRATIGHPWRGVFRKIEIEDEGYISQN